MNELELLPRNALIKTGEVDHADWNYKPLLGWIQRLRFKCVLAMLRDLRFDRLMEVGYGSGVFMPVLKRYCTVLYGVDIHQKAMEVGEVLKANGVIAELYSGSVSMMPFPDEHFDCIVSVSALEFVEDLESGCREMRRVLSPDGIVVVVMPRQSRLLDLGLRVLTGENAADDYAGRRVKVVATLLRYFRQEEGVSVPGGDGIMPKVYTGLKLKARDL